MNTFLPTTTMKEVEVRFPFARTVLHEQFHLGGCQKCSYSPNETISEVAARYSKDEEAIVLALNKGLTSMQEIQVTCEQFAEWQIKNPKLPLIDVREQWEHDHAHISGDILLTPSNMNEVTTMAKSEPAVVLYCHHGVRSMHAAMYMRNQGVNAYSLKGGIDEYSRTINTNIPRY